MSKVRFFGLINNYSGYGNATKNFAKAFSISNIDTNFAFSKKVEKTQANFLSTLNQYHGKCDIDFYLHCPPYTKHKSSAYKIAYFYWEADRLPVSWGAGLNAVDEIWAPCNLVKNACIKAGFKKKIKIIPTPSELNISENKVLIPSPISDDYYVGSDVYKFYSIFQWHNRKGYLELLNAYFKTFNQNDNVLLILKVNPLGVKGYNEANIIGDIIEIKRKLNIKYYPPIYINYDRVPGSTIAALHNTGDCYVSSHHGEGWGMPIHDAMNNQKQIIVTKFGGVTEFLNHNSAHIIKHNIGPVRDMGWSPLYGKYQNWAYPSTAHLSRIFRDVYSNHEAYSEKAVTAKNIANNMTIPAIAKMIEEELG